MTLNVLDLIVLVVVGLSALLSFYRGLFKEMFSLGGWVVASIVSLRFMEPAAAYVRPQVGSEAVAGGIASVGLFFGTLILFSILSGMLMKAIKPAEKIGLVDNLGGLAFGVARGVLILAIGYFIMSVVLAEKNYPTWVKEAASRPYIEKVAKAIREVTPEYLDKLTKENKNAKDGDLGEDAKKHVDSLIRELDTRRDKTIDKVDEVTDDIDHEAEKMPTIEDLQKRIKEENEKRDVR